MEDKRKEQIVLIQLQVQEANWNTVSGPQEEESVKVCQRYGWHAYQSVKACDGADCSELRKQGDTHTLPRRLLQGTVWLTSLTLLPLRDHVISEEV